MECINLDASIIADNTLQNKEKTMESTDCIGVCPGTVGTLQNKEEYMECINAVDAIMIADNTLQK